MSQTFVIHGGKPLSGQVTIGGSKNAFFPLVAACMLTKEECILENVPTISDVDLMVQIAQDLGARAEWDQVNHRLAIEARDVKGICPDPALSRKLRGSIVFAGALVGRMKKAAVAYPGGDAIGARPLTEHFKALESFGVTIKENECIELNGENLHGAVFAMDDPSVTATENAILAAVLAPGKTVMSLVAMEPHVQELVKFLTKMGAKIQWSDRLRIEIEGVKELRGATYTINPDELEVSAFAALAAATRSEVILNGIEPKYLDAVFGQFNKMGVVYEIDGHNLIVRRPSIGYKNSRIQSGLYPKLMSDHLPSFAVLATQAEGTSMVHEWMYENRLRYIPELQKMGTDCEILDPHRALITGPSVLTGTEIESFDIRSGMTLVIAALVAEGKSVISNIEHIDRGYEKLESRLKDLGADIERVLSE